MERGGVFGGQVPAPCPGAIFTNALVGAERRAIRLSLGDDARGRDGVFLGVERPLGASFIEASARDLSVFGKVCYRHGNERLK